MPNTSRGGGPSQEALTRPWRFSVVADLITEWTGSSSAFASAMLLIGLWLLTGPIFGFSDTWQLLINSATSIITFLMVFLIQKTQNRDSRAIHLKLNELIAAAEGASNRLINAQDLDEASLYSIYQRFQALAERCSELPRPTEATTVEEIAEPVVVAAISDVD